MDKKDKKQFPPGFFDKPSEDSNRQNKLGKWFGKHWIWMVLLTVFIIFVIVFALIGWKQCQKSEEGLPPIDTTETSIQQIPVIEDSVPIDKPQAGVQEQTKTPEDSPQKADDAPNVVAKESVIVESKMEETVISVIRGNYGNNPVRRRLLGDRYQEIQDEVNKMYREGKVY